MQKAARFIAISVLLVALFGMFVFYGAAEPAPEHNDYPGEDDLATNYEQYVDQQVELGGTVVETEPMTIAIETDSGTDEYVVQNVPDADHNQELRLFATVHPDNTLEAQNTIVRDSWERTYMYAISVLAALWVVARAHRHWRFDIQEWAFVPRTQDGEHDG